jgi:hypothetical protein
MSFAFASIGLVALAYIYEYKKQLLPSGIQYILLFYIAMEILQGIQYFFVNQCSNAVNIALTEIAYILVLVQPLMWNMFYYFNSEASDKKIFIVAIGLFILWMIFDVLARLLYNKIGLNKTKNYGHAFSDKVCTKQKRTHLYWEWTSADFGSLGANIFSYFLIWFVPALFSQQFRSISLIIMALAAFAGFVPIMNNEFFTFSSLWCYISVPIMLLVCLNYTFSIKK